MKLTSEDLMKAMRLQVGDRVKVDKYNETFELMKSTEGKWRLISKNCSIVDLIWLVDKDYEILPRPKRVGDLKCEDCECVECHLRCLPHCNQLDRAKETLFNILDGWNEYDTFDQEIYDLLKTRLDKEVEE